MNTIIAIIHSPLLWFVFTIISYKLAENLREYKFLKKFPPTCFAAITVILLLKSFSVNYADYNKGAHFISYLLGPATIAFALPLIKNLHILKQNWKIISAGVVVATITGIISVLGIAKLFSITKPIILSIIPKSVTTPIAVDISKSIGGIPELTACIVIITGLIGALFGHRILKLIKVKNHISIGLAIGASSHVLGTSKCFEKNELQAAIGSIALILVGILTAIFAPIILHILNY